MDSPSRLPNKIKIDEGICYRCYLTQDGFTFHSKGGEAERCKTELIIQETVFSIYESQQYRDAFMIRFGQDKNLPNG